MTEPQVRSHSSAFAALVALQAVLPAIIAMTSLRVIAAAFDEAWTDAWEALAVIAGLLCLLLPHAKERNRTSLVERPNSLVVSTMLRWLAILAFLLAIAYTTKYSAHFARRVLITWAFTTPWLIVLAAILVNDLMRRVLHHPDNARRAVFAGASPAGRALYDRMIKSKDTGLQVLGFFDDRAHDRVGLVDPGALLGKLEDLASFVKRARVDVIFIALPVPHVQRVVAMVESLRDTTASLHYVPDLFVFDLIQARSGEMLGVPVVAVCESPMRGYHGVVKRLTDLVLTLAILSLVAPLMVVIALAIRATSPGPVVFRQRRYGLDGEEIVVYKFRTMTVQDDGAKIVQASPDDPRVTRVGRFLRRYSLDELPQLVNVLQGRMSLVGPRPHAVAHNEEYRQLIAGYMLRHKVLPGITGLAQIHGCRGATAKVEDMRQRVSYDIDYVRHWTPMLDLKILAKTVLTVLKHENAY